MLKEKNSENYIYSFSKSEEIAYWEQYFFVSACMLKKT